MIKIEVDKVFLLFEQSGTFKNVLKSKGYESYSFDISNQFNETDYVIDLFNEIENAFIGKPSIFDSISKDDLVIAFFPCTYFSIQNNLIFALKLPQFKNWSDEKKEEYITKRKESRKYFFSILEKFVSIIKQKKLRTIIENPYTGNWLLKKKGFENPSLVIGDRTVYGDYYVKSTMFYYYNFEPSYLCESIKYEHNKFEGGINDHSGITRSLMHPTFVSNFLNKYVFGIR